MKLNLLVLLLLAKLSSFCSLNVSIWALLLTDRAVTPAHRGVGGKGQGADQADADQPITPRHIAMTWAQRLKGVFGVEIHTCTRCGGTLKVIASIEDPEVIAKILAHREQTAPDHGQAELPLGARAPPVQARLI
jgi:hypothetical protein